MNTTLPSITEDCPIAGNNDLYGFGLRLGIYFQMVSIILTRILRMQTSSSLRTSTFIFVLATSAVVLRMVFQRDVHGFELLIIMWLLIPQLTLSFQPAWAWRNPISARFMMCFLTGVGIFFCWFWFKGIETLPKSTCVDEYTWFFAKVSVHHWFRTLSKVLWILDVLSTGGVTVIMLVYWQRADEEPAENMGITTPLTIVPFSIAACEMTIKWNGITDVTNLASVSQMVPFILGLGQLVDTLYRIARVRIGDDEGAEESDGASAVSEKSCSHRYRSIRNPDDHEMAPLRPPL